MTVTIVVAVASNGVIGAHGDIPWPRTGDQRQFKELTMGHPIVMGRATYDSIGFPLPGRTSIVVTRDPEWTAHEEVIVAHGLGEAFAAAHALADQVFLIGGAQVYAAAMDAGLVDELVVTHIPVAPDGDAWFHIDDTAWTETARTHYSDGTPPYDIATYRPR